jgi:hypothetical protein
MDQVELAEVVVALQVLPLGVHSLCPQTCRQNFSEQYWQKQDEKPCDQQESRKKSEDNQTHFLEISGSKFPVQFFNTKQSQAESTTE